MFYEYKLYIDANHWVCIYSVSKKIVVYKYEFYYTLIAVIVST